MIVEEQREQFISYQIDNITLPLASKVLNLAYYCYKKFSSKSTYLRRIASIFFIINTILWIPWGITYSALHGYIQHTSKRQATHVYQQKKKRYSCCIKKLQNLSLKSKYCSRTVPIARAICKKKKKVIPYSKLIYTKKSFIFCSVIYCTFLLKKQDFGKKFE